MSNKSKGSNAERELVSLFTENGWRAVRVAGSGVNDESPCDIIVGKVGQQGHVIEAKSSRSEHIYIKKSQIEDFMLFASVIGLKPVIAARFTYEGWLFIDPSQLIDSGKSFVIHRKNVKIEGKKFSQYFEPNKIVETISN
jgi:Holliday junction resolvase